MAGTVITAAANNINIVNGTASLDVAAGSAVDVNANLTVEAASAINQDVTSDASPTFAGATLSGLTASRGVVTDGSKALTSDSAATGTGAPVRADSPTFTTKITTPQVQFPATQSASSDANCLDDYEEGTWTPVIGGAGGTSGQTYSVQLGRYVKIGKLVIIQCYATLTAKGTITGNLELQGLPFAAENIANLMSAASIARVEDWTLSSGHVLTLRVLASGSIGSFSEYAGTGSLDSSTILTTANVNDSTSVIMTISYRTD